MTPYLSAVPPEGDIAADAGGTTPGPRSVRTPGEPSGRPGEVAPPRITASRTGRVVGVETGVVLVRAGRDRLRASFGGDLLARIAADRDAAPRIGDRVRLACWPDGRTTCEGVLARPV